ncbi:hypothetical protein HYV85_04925 [Candidatus Woesearchaeota archaeon]|nr:hypothetical protein [Candidatus Woesearchaeota archaeon]
MRPLEALFIEEQEALARQPWSEFEAAVAGFLPYYKHQPFFDLVRVLGMFLPEYVSRPLAADERGKNKAAKLRRAVMERVKDVAERYEIAITMPDVVDYLSGFASRIIESADRNLPGFNQETLGIGELLDEKIASSDFTSVRAYYEVTGSVFSRPDVWVVTAIKHVESFRLRCLAYYAPINLSPANLSQSNWPIASLSPAEPLDNAARSTLSLTAPLFWKAFLGYVAGTQRSPGTIKDLESRFYADPRIESKLSLMEARGLLVNNIFERALKELGARYIVRNPRYSAYSIVSRNQLPAAESLSEGDLSLLPLEVRLMQTGAEPQYAAALGGNLKTHFTRAFGSFGKSLMLRIGKSPGDVRNGNGVGVPTVGGVMAYARKIGDFTLESLRQVAAIGENGVSALLAALPPLGQQATG